MRDQAAYLAQLRALMPSGAAWPRHDDARLSQLLSGFSAELARIDGRALQLFDEIDPRTTAEMLLDWERVAGLPDPCAQQVLDIGELSGNAVDALPNTITLAAGASAVADAYNGQVVRLTGGTGAGQERTVTDYAVATNLLTWPEDFSNSVWLTGNAAIIANTATAPDGSITADTLTATGIGGYIFQNPSLFASAGGADYVASCFVKASTSSSFVILLAAAAIYQATFDLSAGAVSSTTGSVSAKIKPAVDGWWLISVVFEAVASNAYSELQFGRLAIGESAYIWGAFLGTTDGPYVATTSASATGKVATVDRKWSPEYLSLPGTAGNSVETAATPGQDITSDLEIRVCAALDDWSGTDANGLVEKQGAYRLLVVAVGTGVIRFDWWDSSLGGLQAVYSAEHGLSPGEKTHIKVTFDTDNGAGGATCRFYLSGDGETWSQLGSDAVTASTTEIDVVASTSLTLGERDLAAQASGAGRYYSAEIRNGIDGPVVASFNPFRDALAGDTSFQSSATGEVWTINQSGAIPAVLAGLPDSTTTYTVTRPPSDYVEQTTAERRAALLARLSVLGGQTPAWFTSLASALGYVITIDEFAEHSVDHDVDHPAYGADWPHAFQVNAGASSVTTLDVNGSVDDALASWGNSGLECAIDRLKPAHSTAIYSYT